MHACIDVQCSVSVNEYIYIISDSLCDLDFHAQRCLMHLSQWLTRSDCTVLSASTGREEPVHRHAGQHRSHHPPDVYYQHAARASSPGRALTDVKARLAQYAQRQQPSGRIRPQSPSPQPGHSHSHSHHRDAEVMLRHRPKHGHGSPERQEARHSPKRNSPGKVLFMSALTFETDLYQSMTNAKEDAADIQLLTFRSECLKDSS